MRNLLSILFILQFVSSCSDTDNGTIPEIIDEGDHTIEKVIPLDLEIEETQKNIFDYTVFSLFPDQYGVMFSLFDVYDSITWKASNVDGSLKIFQYTTRGANFIRQWSHTFTSPGNYKTYVLGYKNNEVIYSDTAEVEITNTKDFLCYNWKDIKGSIGHGVSYVDVLNDYEFSTFEDMHQGIPSVTVFLIDKKKNNKPAFLKKSKKIFTDYINSLYSTQPVHYETENDLLEKYNDLFIYKPKSTYPICIWITPKSKIALIKEEIHNEYQLYAEPQ